MKQSVEKLRWGLAATGLLLLLAVMGSLGYSHYRQIRKWRDTLRRLNLHGPHETTGFTYSSSPKDRTSYKVRAARVIEHGDGTWSLHDVALTLYSKTSSDEDHVYASDIEYDQNSGVARAIGAVHMDLQVAGAMKTGKSEPPTAPSSQAADAGADEIHVQTSGLVYVHKLGVAATDEPVQFEYKDMQCTSKGAEFDSNSSQLHLLADVALHGTLQRAPLEVRAAKADLDRDQNLVVASHAVAQSKGRTITAETITAHMRKDGSIESAEAGKGVSMVSGTRRMDAASYAGTFNADSLPQNAKLIGNVVATDTNPDRPARGQSDELDAAFDAKGELVALDARGHASVMTAERRPGIADLKREMHGDRLVATLAASAQSGHAATSQLQELHASGSAAAMGESLAADGGRKTTRLQADELDARFAGDAKKPVLTHVSGQGHSNLEQDGPQQQRQTTASDQMEASFVMATDGGRTQARQATHAATGGEGNDANVHNSVASLEISSATETGHVVLHMYPAMKPGVAPQPASMATGDRAVYEKSTAKLMLTGSAGGGPAHFMQAGTTLDAATIVVDEQTEDAAAQGNVLASVTNTAAPASTPTPASSATQQATTHVAADHATLTHATQVAQFYGNSRQAARLWQGASQVQAATLVLDQKKKTLSARPSRGSLVHAVFANMSAGGDHEKTDGTAPEVVRVAAATMDYDDLRREADFGGGVLIESPTAQAKAQRGVAILTDAAGVGGRKTGAADGRQSKPGSTPGSSFGGSLQRIVLSEDVHLDQSGRTGSGSQLVYTAETGTYVLTGAPGKPPHIVDPQQGSVTGASLSFHGADSTIVVNGNTSAQSAGRVRTEVEVRGK